jgi:hypothetical protein
VVVSLADSLGLSPVDISARLQVLGFDTPDPAALPASGEPYDAQILQGLGVNGNVALGQVANAAVRAGLTSEQVAHRLRAFGYTVPDVSGLPVRPTPGDVRLLSQDRDGKAPWIDHASTTRLHRIVAPRGQCLSFAEVQALLSALQLALPDDSERPPEDAADPGSIPPWLARGYSVPLAEVTILALSTGLDMPEACERLRALGLDVPDSDDLPDRLDERDAVMLSAFLTGERPWLAGDTVTRARVFAIVAKTGFDVPAVCARLSALGFGVPGAADLTARLTPHDWHAVNTFFDILGNEENGVLDPVTWLEPQLEPLPLGLVINVAVSLGRPVAEVSSLLTILGFTVPEVRHLPDSLGRDDVRLLSQDIDGEYPWISPRELSPGGVAVAAAGTGLSMAQAAARLAELGFTIPKAASLAVRLTRDDVQLLSEGLNRREPWIDPDEDVSPVHIFQIAREGLDVARSCARLRELGFRLPGYLEVDLPETGGGPALRGIAVSRRGGG